VVPAAIIGLAEAPFDLVPLSAIRRLTDAERTRRAAELAAIKRDEELAAAAAREAWRMSADGQRERVRALEAEMAALRAGSAPPQPIPATEGA
jgi:regulator of protease activity HflC (stomatin/prohibitin superfamily)